VSLVANRTLQHLTFAGTLLMLVTIG